MEMMATPLVKRHVLSRQSDGDESCNNDNDADQDNNVVETLRRPVQVPMMQMEKEVENLQSENTSTVISEMRSFHGSSDIKSNSAIQVN